MPRPPSPGVRPAGRHSAEREARPRGHRGRHRRRPSRHRPLTLALTACAGLLALTVVVLGVLTRPPGPAEAAPAAGDVTDTSRASTPEEVSRQFERAVQAPSPPPSVVPDPRPAPPAPAPPPAHPKPVAGLTQAQMDNAATIVRTGQSMKLPSRAYVVAITTALQESTLLNLANPNVSQSLSQPHQGTGSNLDSLGLFQQRPSQGWGTVAQLMNPATASRLFYERLVKVSGWDTMSVAAAAQAVQRSAFPDAYAKQVTRAQQIVTALTA